MKGVMESDQVDGLVSKQNWTPLAKAFSKKLHTQYKYVQGPKLISSVGYFLMKFFGEGFDHKLVTEYIQLERLT